MSTEQHMPGGRTYHFGVADRIRAAREHAGMDQGQLADITGISRGSVSNYERGITRPRRLQLAAIALATGFSYEWLDTGQEPNPDPGNGFPVIEHSITDVGQRDRWDAALALLMAGIAA